MASTHSVGLCSIFLLQVFLGPSLGTGKSSPALLLCSNFIDKKGSADLENKEQ